VRKLILKCGFSPGDIVMLTCAVRDLHLCYPGEFLTDVRTACPDLWENNPYVTPLVESERGVEVLECVYPLIDQCNETPYHCLHGFIEFLNDHLGLRIRPTSFKGDIHLGAQEKLWYSQVHEWAGEEIPFWIIAAGGKYDVTIKWWSVERYQQVVDHFRGRILFAQVGAIGHHHPKLDGVIDLRGRTSLRELIRLVYHSQGVLCGVTALMHLAAAVEFKLGGPPWRPAVVVAGGREPAHWEAYPHHQFLHTNGALACCTRGGCWRDRTIPLGDGDHRDGADHLCVEVRNGLPRCMDMITADEVINRIELYFSGGVVSPLTPGQIKAAKRGASRSRTNPYDEQGLRLENARMALEDFARRIAPNSGKFEGRGIVICGGGVRHFTNAWVCIRMLRHQGCKLPIELWHLGGDEMDSEMERLVEPFGVRCVDAGIKRKSSPARILGGWELKAYALVHTEFREILLLDADNVPVADPEYLFESVSYRETGAVFWPDYGRLERTQVIWDSCGLERPEGPEFESGQILVDKEKCWRALALALWMNEHSDFYYEYLYGDKETFHLAFEKVGQPYSMISTPILPLEGTMCQHDFAGARVFQHRNMDKWHLMPRNRAVPGFWRENDCRQFLDELRRSWDGRISRYPLRGRRNGTRAPKLMACMISCPERTDMREETLRNLAGTDWGGRPVLVRVDRRAHEDRQRSQVETSLLALKECLKERMDYVLFLEDDLCFNRHLAHNLLHWLPLKEGAITLAGLYNPNLHEVACDIKNHLLVMASEAVYGSQAFLLSRRAIRFFIKHWEEVEGMQDIRMSRLAGALGGPIYYHAPSLVQHVGKKSVWGGLFHEAIDFDAEWRV
jgi:hypothetical protein